MTFNKTKVTINGKSGIYYCEPHMIKLPSHAETQREDWESQAFPIWVNDQGQYETMIERSGYASHALEEIERHLRIFMLNEGYDDDDFPRDMAPTFTHPIHVAELGTGHEDDEEIFGIMDRLVWGAGTPLQQDLARDAVDANSDGVIRIHSATDKCNAMRMALEIVEALNCANYTAKLNEI